MRIILKEMKTMRNSFKLIFPSHHPVKNLFLITLAEAVFHRIYCVNLVFLLSNRSKKKTLTMNKPMHESRNQIPWVIIQESTQVRLNLLLPPDINTQRTRFGLDAAEDDVTAVSLRPAGQITLSEFMEGAQKDEWVMKLLKLDVNATGWVIQNCGWVGPPPTGVETEAETHFPELPVTWGRSSVVFVFSRLQLTSWFGLQVRSPRRVSESMCCLMRDRHLLRFYMTYHCVFSDDVGQLWL